MNYLCGDGDCRQVAPLCAGYAADKCAHGIALSFTCATIYRLYNTKAPPYNYLDSMPWSNTCARPHCAFFKEMLYALTRNLGWQTGVCHPVCCG